MGRELRFADGVDQSPVEGIARFRSVRPQRGQDRPHFVPPQEMGQHKRIDVRVSTRALQDVEPHGATRTPIRPHDTALGWHALQRRPDMAVGNHQCQLLQGLAVGLKLVPRPPGTVDRALDLEPVNDAVDHREIGPPPGMCEARFVDDQRVRVPHMASKRLCQQSLPDCPIIQWRTEDAFRTVPPYRCPGHRLVIFPPTRRRSGSVDETSLTPFRCHDALDEVSA